MNPQPLFCANDACSSRGLQGAGNICVLDSLRQRWRCTTCKKTFRATQGTLFHGKKYPPETLVVVLTLLSLGCPLQAIVVAFHIDERTIRRWQKQAGAHCEQFHEEHVTKHPMDLGQVQADEMYVKLQKRLVLWMAMALCIPTRLWLGGVISRSRDQTMLQQLATKVKRCAKCAPILLITDGFAGYVRAWQDAFREPKRIGKVGRPALIAWKEVVIAQMVKQYQKGRVVGIDQRLVQGSVSQLLALLPEECKISTAYIERLNATFRARCHGLVRRGRGLSKKPSTLEQSMYLVGCLYNFCTPHQSLRCEYARTPAMAAGLTDHCWSVGELLSYRFAPAAFVAKKRRGRKPKVKAELQEGDKQFVTG
jgi:transposase-like protein